MNCLLYAFKKYQNVRRIYRKLEHTLLPTTKSQHQMKSGFFLDVVVRQGPAIFQLLSSEDQTLLIWGDTFFVLDFSFDIFNGVRSFNFQCDGFASQCFHKYLHSTTKSQHQMKSGFFLDVVVRQSPSIFQLFSSKDQTLLVWWDTFFV